MQSRAINYQRNLLTELITVDESDNVLSSAEAEHLRERITAADSSETIEELWTELEQTYGLLDEEIWAT